MNRIVHDMYVAHFTQSILPYAHLTYQEPLDKLTKTHSSNIPFLRTKWLSRLEMWLTSEVEDK